MSDYKSTRPIGTRLRARRNSFPYSQLYSRSTVGKTDRNRKKSDSQMTEISCSNERNSNTTCIEVSSSRGESSQTTKLSLLIGPERIISCSLEYQNSAKVESDFRGTEGTPRRFEISRNEFGRNSSQVGCDVRHPHFDYYSIKEESDTSNREEVTFKRFSTDDEISFKHEHDSSSDNSIASTVYQSKASSPNSDFPCDTSNSLHICSNECSGETSDNDNKRTVSLENTEELLSQNGTFAPVLTPCAVDEKVLSTKSRRSASLDSRVKTMLVLEKSKAKNVSRQSPSKAEWLQSCFTGKSIPTVQIYKTAGLIDRTNCARTGSTSSMKQGVVKKSKNKNEGGKSRGLRPMVRERPMNDVVDQSDQHCQQCLSVLNYLLVKTSRTLLSEYNQLTSGCSNKLCHECICRSVGETALSSVPSSLPMDESTFEVITKKKKSVPSSARDRDYTSGWQFEGEPVNKRLYCRLPDGQYRHVVRSCYESVSNDGVRLRSGDQVLVASETRPEPFVAAISDLYICPITGTKSARVFWYYGQEILCDSQRILHERELVASKHSDDIDLNCIEDKAFVLTFNQYCRYMCQQKLETVYTWFDPSRPPPIISSRTDLKDTTDPEVVYWCRKVFDLQRKKILKNPH